MRPCLRKLLSSAPQGLAPREGLELVLMKMGRAGPPFEPCRGSQAGKSGDSRSQNANSSPRAQGAPGLGRAERRKGKCEASRALTACVLGRRVAVDWTWAPQQPHELIKERHLSRLCLLCFLRLLLRSPFLRLSFLPLKSSDLLRLRALARHGASPGPGRSLVFIRPGLAERIGGEPRSGAPDGGGAGHRRGEGVQGRLRHL